MTAYYNEIDPFAAAWLRELIAAGEIAPGDVDTRSIEDVCPDDLRSYTQCHFFAGIGIWSHALRRAGWDDDRPIWTGSCPCQPFSSAGERNGFADERHLWPAMFHLIAAKRPDTVIGEQVASKDGLAWLDLVSSDMEAARYAFGAVDMCAAGFGAPHIRQRTWWVGRLADGTSERWERRWSSETGNQFGAIERFERFCITGGRGEPGRSITPSSISDGLGHADGQRQTQVGRIFEGATTEFAGRRAARIERPGPTNGHWRDVDWLYCRDERWRPVRPGSFPLVNGAPARVGRLRGYGNGIVAPVAIGFIEAVKEIIENKY